MSLRFVIITLFLIWFVSVLLGRGGLIHTLLLLAIGISTVQIVAAYRTRQR